MRCHNQAANFVLGFNTHQLNGLQYYKQLGFEMNQLEYFSQEGLLNQNLTDIESLDRSYSLYDETIDLETRIKSYLDSNCASCHRSGNISNVDLDLRFGLPVKFQNSINVPTQSTASNKNNLIIKPGDHLNSELWLRDSSNDENRMPPLARSLVDQNYVDSLAKWIGQLTDEDAFIDANYFYPNPSNGIYNLRLEESWLAPINLRIFTFSGHLVYETELLQNSNRLNLHHLSSGTYFLTAVSEDKNFNQKFIKI